MQITIETLEGLQRKMTLTVPADRVSTAYQARLNKVAKQARVDGFRPGKVPTKVLDQKFGASVLQEVAGELVQQTLQEAIEEKELRVAGMPAVDLITMKKGEALEYTATFDIYPDIELKELDGQTIEKINAEITDSDIDDMLEKIRKQHAVWISVDREAATGDQVTIDFDGYIEDEPFEGGKADGFKLELGSGQMIPGFEDGIIGNKAGSESEIRLPFPDDYHAADLAGKDAKFKIKVHKVEEPQLPEVNDELAEKMGIKEGGLAELKNKMRTNMERELKQRLQTQVKESAFEKLSELNSDVLVPQALIDQEIEHLKEATRKQMGAQNGGKALPNIDLPSNLYEPQAKKRVLLGLLLSALVEKYELKADKTAVKAKIDDLSASYDKPDEVAQWYYQNEQILTEIEASVLEDMAVEKLLEAAKVSEKSETYDKIVNSDNK